MSKTLHHIPRPFTTGLAPKRAGEEKAELLSESYVYLEDDVLFAIHDLATHDGSPELWRLVEDAYGNAFFSPEEARRLAAECAALMPTAGALAAIWLSTIAGFAAGCGVHGSHLAAEAD